MNDQVPNGAPLNFQEEGEVQKAKQPLYSAVAQGATVPRAKPVDAAPNKPVSAMAAAGPKGYMLCCTNQTEAECLSRMLFGAPEGQWPLMKKNIGVGSAVFLYNKDKKVVMGPYVAVSDPGWKLEKDAWSTVGKGRGFPAQVRVQAQGTVRRVMVRKCEALKGGPMTAAQVNEYQGAMGGWAMPKPKEVSAAQDTVVSAVQEEERQGAQQRQGAADQTQAKGNRTVRGLVMPKPREVGAAQNTGAGGARAGQQGGYMFHCTRQTEAECLERMLFGAPEKDMQMTKQQVKVGLAVFLYSTETRIVMGPFVAMEEPGKWLEKDAWNTSTRKFAAQVRVQAHGVVKQ